MTRQVSTSHLSVALHHVLDHATENRLDYDNIEGDVYEGITVWTTDVFDWSSSLAGIEVEVSERTPCERHLIRLQGRTGLGVNVNVKGFVPAEPPIGYDLTLDGYALTDKGASA